MSLEHYTVSIRTSVARGLQPKADMGINARKTDLRWTLNIEGGFQDAEIGLAANMPWPVVGYLPQAIDIQFHDDVTIRRGSAVLWNGRVRRRRLGAGGLVVGIVCEGYLAALGDDWIRDTSATSVLSGAALEAAITNYAASLTAGNADQFQAPAVAHAGGMVEFFKLTPGQLANLIVQEGDTDRNRVDVQIWEGRVVHVRSRAYPETPTYRAPFDPTRVNWDEDCGEMADRVQVETQGDADLHDAGTFTWLAAEATTDAFADTWGFSRALLIPSGDQQAAAAAVFRDTELARRANPQVQATVNVTADPATWLTRSGAGPWPYWLVRPDGATVEVAGRPQQHIVGVTVDATAGEATFELGSLDPTMPKNWLVRERTQSVLARHYIDANSGTRVR